MSYIRNDTADFADDARAGFAAAHSRVVRAVPGGVARRGATPAGQVAVVIGGGSGHYPAFAGLVGPGLAHGAVMGNVFASPSAHQVVSVAKAVAGDAGVLLSYGNYAGDALNFDEAQDALRAQGIPCETVRVTDDVYSADEDERARRRGIAGDLAVFRVAAWAAEQGRALRDVARLAAHANERTRSIGVAFSGCTLPGADAPLFTVAPGQMAVGMGIHGEPGIETRPLPSARGLAGLLVDRLLLESPHDGDATPRVAVIVNGLGSVKAEELFILYHEVAARLDGMGIAIVEPEVGEYATSFEMAGVSLTLMWLDDELERAWRSPAAAPGYRKGNADTAIADAAADEVAADDGREAVAPAATPEAAQAGGRVAAVLAAMKAVIDDNVDELGRLDAVAGDGDHGIGMQRGVRAAAGAARDAAVQGAGAGTVLVAAGDAWADHAGGTSGALWGRALRAAGARIGDSSSPDARTVAAAVSAATDAVQSFGKADVGDKTLVDALVPFARRLEDDAADGLPLSVAWKNAAITATKAAQATAGLLPRVGRARPHQEKSLGTPDPGAVSLALAVTAAAVALEPSSTPRETEN